jgi:oligogalacturonide lyase
MNKYLRFAACAAASFILMHPSLHAQGDPVGAVVRVSDEFRDSETGARVLHLFNDAKVPSGVIYFTQECITPDSRYALVRELVASAGHTAGLMYRYDFKTGELVKLTDLMTKNQVMVGKSGNLYFTSDEDRSIYVTNIFDLKTRKVEVMPAGIVCSGGLTVNADETLVVGTGTLTQDRKPISMTPPNQGPGFGGTYARHETNLLLAVAIKTGAVTELQRINTWLGHVQFSPVDAKLLMYCHEGPWEKVDRIWTVRIDNPSKPRNLLTRTQPGEIAGHEFWASDGASIWYDHNFRGGPGGHWLEGKNLATGVVTRYPISPEFASIHYTQSPDGKFFVCDGSPNKKDPSKQGMFILVPKEGKLEATKLCSMAKNDYKEAEPNPHVTPDQHWVLFTATFSGVAQAYAMEMPKEFWRKL